MIRPVTAVELTAYVHTRILEFTARENICVGGA
jgi:hypothetical protein